MRFILILLIALALTLAWQTTVLAEFPFGVKQVSACQSDKPVTPGGSSEDSGDEEPECE